MENLREKKPRILVVDDNFDAGDLLCLLLSTHGYTVVFCTDPCAAVERALEFAPDFILLDIGMPVMDGFEVAHQLRQCSELVAVRVIALTAWNDKETISKSLQAGFDTHLCKPVRIDRLLSELRKPGTDSSTTIDRF